MPRFSGINIILNFIGIGLLISTITVIVFTLKLIFDSMVGNELYYFVRFYFNYLFDEIKELLLKLSGSIKFKKE